MTKTTELGVQALVFLALSNDDKPIPPHKIASHLGSSPTYMKKITNLLVKGNILHSHRGALGGVTLDRAPSEVSMLEIVEACQGRILGDYCQEYENMDLVCSYHRIMANIRDKTVEILSRWTLMDLISKPCPTGEIAGLVSCRVEKGCPPSFNKAMDA